MSATLSALVSVLSVVLSGAIGGLTVWLSLRKRFEEESLGRAMRRTAALQLLSDEEFAIQQVRDECVLVDSLVRLRRSEIYQAHLRAETQRVLSESSEMLADVRARRKNVEAVIVSLPAAELEAVIANAYHGKRRAEAQGDVPGSVERVS